VTPSLRIPPKKQPGQGTGPRRVNGALLDMRSGAAFLGNTEKGARGLVARRLIPFRRLGGRIYFVRAELERYIASLDGCGLDEALANLKERE
jgi:hypothetical protein